MRIRPRSIRARDTVIAALLSALVLGGIAVISDLLLHKTIADTYLGEAQVAARRVSAALREGTLATPIPSGPDDSVLIQVVDADGRVINSTPRAAGRPPLSSVRPPAHNRVQVLTECGVATRGCLQLEAIRVTTAPDSPVVYGGRELPSYLRNGLLELAFAAMVALLSGSAALITWHMVGRTLRPVTQIRTQLAEISGSDLSRRVPQPGGDDEIAQLARTANETLDRLQRSVERQRRFASDASHELRTPIAGLRANLEDAQMHPGDTDLPTTIDAALRDTDRLESIVTDLLLLARIGTGGAATERVDLADLLRTELTARATSASIRTELTPGLSVQGVRVQLVRLLNNLLDNAERYGDGEIEVALRPEGDQAVLTVTDSGPGIPEADRERIFERFTRLDSARSRGAGGTGLGLAIARDIAVAHGGSLRVADSARGARFALHLPLVSANL